MKLHPFYFTFGQKYRREEHPANDLVGVKLHPDGYVTVLAETPGVARDVADKALHGQWSMQYNVEPTKDMFPKGNLATITG